MSSSLLTTPISRIKSPSAVSRLTSITSHIQQESKARFVSSTTTPATTKMARLRFANPALFICDVQEKFRPAIWEYGHVITTSQKMVKACKILNIPIYVTTQNAARLGATVKEVADLLPPAQSSSSTNGTSTNPESTTDNSATITSTFVEVDKTAFSMLVPSIREALLTQSPSPTNKLEVMIVGIESHVCVTQTALDLISMGHKVYILQDGVSSCNSGERPVALARLAREGCVVTTSESVLFELVGDAGDKDFKKIAGLIKETKEETKKAVEVLCT